MIFQPLLCGSSLREGLGAGRWLSVGVADAGPAPDQVSGHELPDHVAADLRNVLLGEADASLSCDVLGVLAGEDPAVDTAHLLGDGSDDLCGEDPGIVLTVEPHG